jgi:hypothetical protein
MAEIRRGRMESIGFTTNGSLPLPPIELTNWPEKVAIGKPYLIMYGHSNMHYYESLFTCNLKVATAQVAEVGKCGFLHPDFPIHLETAVRGGLLQSFEHRPKNEIVEELSYAIRQPLVGVEGSLTNHKNFIDYIAGTVTCSDTNNIFRDKTYLFYEGNRHEGIYLMYVLEGRNIFLNLFHNDVFRTHYANKSDTNIEVTKRNLFSFLVEYLQRLGIREEVLFLDNSCMELIDFPNEARRTILGLGAVPHIMLGGSKTRKRFKK